MAARDGDFPNRAALAALLLEHGADPNVRGRINGGVTPLMKAAAKGEVGLVRVLIRNGADVNATDRWGGSALGTARWVGAVQARTGSHSFRDTAAVARLLRQAGATR